MKSYQFELPCYGKGNGKLGTFEPLLIPRFQIDRIIYIFDVPFDETRADHACMNASLVFVAFACSVKLSIETEEVITEYALQDKATAVYSPIASWIKAYDFSDDAVLI